LLVKTREKEGKMSVNTILIIIAFSSVFAIIWAIAAKNYKDRLKETYGKNNRMLSYFLDEQLSEYGVIFITTVVGVFIGIWLTNIGESNSNKQNACKILEACSFECKIIQERTTSYLTYLTLPEDDPHYMSLSNYNSQPLLPIVSLSMVLQNEIVINNTHASTYRALIDVYRALNHSFLSINPAESLDKLVSELGRIRDYVMYCEKLIDLEVAFQKEKDTYFEMKLAELH